MNTVTHKSNKSLIMQEIRENLKKKSEPGQPPLSRKESNRTWREDILGILSEDQKKRIRSEKQQKRVKNKFKDTENDIE